MHPVVGQGDGTGEHAASQVDFGSRVGLVAPVGPQVGVEEGFHLAQGVVAVFGFFGDEVSEACMLDALGDGVDEGPFSVGVVDVELGSDR